MITDLQFEVNFKVLLPETYTLLKSGNLVLHEAVSGVVLHGSRGLKGGARPDSDIDLSLIVEPTDLSSQADKNGFLREITETTLNNWRNQVELDLAVVFDTRNCGLKCFCQVDWSEDFCKQGGIECFGLYKIQKGFKGLVVGADVEVNKMYPCLRIWSRE